MKISSLAVTAVALLANAGDAVASSSSSLSSAAGAPISSSGKSKYLPWTRAKIYNPIGGETAAVEDSDSSVLLGEDEEASESLDVSIPLSQSSTLGANDAPLTRDIEMLTEILSDLVLHENEKVHQLCQEFIDYGRQRYVCMDSLCFVDLREGETQMFFINPFQECFFLIITFSASLITSFVICL